MKKTVLIVMADKIVKNVLEFCFSRKNYSVITFDSGTEFFNSKEVTSDVSLVVTDIVLPNRSGIELYDEIREDGFSFPVFFVSSKNISSDLGRRMKKDIKIRYFQKPFDPEEVVSEAGRLFDDKV